MVDNEITLQPNDDDTMFGVETDNPLCTSTGIKLQDSVLLSDDDSSSKHGLYEDKSVTDESTRKHPSESEATTDETGQHSTCETDQTEELDVEGMFDRLEPDIPWRWGSAYEFLGESYTPRQKLFADLINEMLYIERPNDKLTSESEWVQALVTGPTDEQFESLRSFLFYARCHETHLYLPYTHTPDVNELQKMGEFCISKWPPGLCDFTIYSELHGLAEDDAYRHAILLWKQRSRLPTTYNYDDAPEIGTETKQLLTIDHIMGRSTYAESNEAEERSKGKSVEEAYAIWREIESRISKGIQERDIPSSTDDERRDLDLQQGTTEVEMGQEPELKMSKAPGEGPEPVPRQCRYKEYFFSEGRDYTCCTECTQCKDLKAQGEEFRVGAHHVVLVRAAIRDRYWRGDHNHDNVYCTFKVEALRHDHEETDHNGTEDYWKSNKFYSKLYRQTRDELMESWPFDDFREACIRYKLKPINISFDGYDEGNVKRQIVPLHTAHKKLSLLSQPRHVIDTDGRHGRRNGNYGGIFTVLMTVETRTDKALLQRIQYADDKFAQRLKDIMTDHRGADPIFTIGSLLLAFAAKQRDDIEDCRNPVFPPYESTDMKDTMDKKSWGDYKSLLDFYRKREKEAQQECGKASHTSCTHGPRMDAETSIVSHNGTAKIQTCRNKDTNKRPNLVAVKSCKASTGTRYTSKPAQQEKSSSRSIHTWTQNPIYQSHTAKSRPRSRDGGRRSSDVQARRNVFERLANQAIQKPKDDEEDDKAKRSKFSKSSR